MLGFITLYKVFQTFVHPPLINSLKELCICIPQLYSIKIVLHFPMAYFKLKQHWNFNFIFQNMVETKLTFVVKSEKNLFI